MKQLEGFKVIKGEMKPRGTTRRGFGRFEGSSEFKWVRYGRFVLFEFI